MTTRRLALGCAWGGVVFFAVTGAWAFLSPHSFYSTLALYPPYTKHLFHDAGAFQLAVAAGLVAGIVGRRPLAVGLWGGAVGAVLHAVSHWIDRNLGGRPSDPFLLTLFAAMLVAGLIAAEVERR
jgi:hypothetical protein